MANRVQAETAARGEDDPFQTGDIDRRRADAMLAGENRLLHMVLKREPLPDILETLCRLAEEAVPGSFGSILLVAPDGKHLSPGAGPSLPLTFTQQLDASPIVAGVGPCELAAMEGQQVIVANFELDERWSPRYRQLALSHDLKACWSRPILSRGGSVLGTFALYYREPRTPTPAEQKIIEQFTYTASIAIERSQSEEAFWRIQAYQAEAQRLSLTGSFSWDVRTGELMWSSETYRIYAYDPAMKPTFELARQRLHPDDVALFNETARRGKEDGVEIDFGHRLLMPDGSVKWLQIVATPVCDAAGEPVEYIGAVRDVTEERRSEDALNAVRAELAHVARVATMRELTASIAQEVNQPLAGVTMNGDACLRWLADGSINLEEAREAARRSIRDAKRAADIIERLRELFRKESTARGPVQMNEAILDVLALSRSELERGRVVVRTELSPELPPVVGDRVQLQQVILNLIMNAAEAMSSVEDRPREMVVKTTTNDEAVVRIEVQDSGTGLGAQDLERVFDAFYTTKSGAMGMGLSIARSIVETHGGRLRATPNAEHGATFAFTVPRLVQQYEPSTNTNVP